jgi:hypothetical protein
LYLCGKEGRDIEWAMKIIAKAKKKAMKAASTTVAV